MREWFFLGYILLVPIMVNNPSVPLWRGALGARIQLSDVLFVPLAASCLSCLGQLKLVLADKRLLLLLSCFVISCLISAAVAGQQSSWADAAGTVYLAAVFVITILLASEQRVFTDALAAWWLAVVLVLICGAVGLLLLGGFGIANPFAHINRLSPYVGTALKATSTLKPTSNTLAAYLAVSIGPLLAASTSWGRTARMRQWLARLAWACGALALWTFSRGMFGVLLALGLVAVRQGLRPGRLRRVAVWTFGIFLAVFFLAIQVVSVVRPISLKASVDRVTLSSSKPDVFPHPGGTAEHLHIDGIYGYDAYGWLKRSAWMTFTRHPWVGVGLERFQEGTRLLVMEGRIPHGIDRYASSQSTVFTLLAEQGLFGTLGFVAFWLTVGRRCWRAICQNNGSRESAFCVGFFASWVALSLDSLNLDLQKFRFIWVFLGLAWVASQRALVGERHA